MGFAYKISDQQGVYYVTATVVQWVDVFTRPAYKDIVVDSLKFCQKNKGLCIYGWVIMTNHLHMICRCSEGFELSDTLRDLKKFTSTAVVNAIAENIQESRKSWLLWLQQQKDGIQFWQEGNHPEAIFTEKFLLQKLNYIHMNPVTAGIVDNEVAYIYSSARDYNGVKGLIELEGF